MNNQKKNRNKGFSLVELIVVIAIMAILVGVAVPVYTSYIEKSQKAKDIQLVDEVKHAVEIAAAAENWAGQLPAGTEQACIGFVVIKSNGTSYITPGENGVEMPVTAALTATFGDLSKLTLSYGGWKGTLGEGGAAIVATSSFNGNAQYLMNDIQSLTNAVYDFAQSSTGDDAIATLFSQYLSDDMVRSLGFSDPITPQKRANAATLFVAQKTLEYADTPEEMEAWKSGWQNGWIGGEVGFDASDALISMAAQFARMDAMVCYSGCPTMRKLFKVNIDTSSPTAIRSSLNAIQQQITDHVCTDSCEICCSRILGLDPNNLDLESSDAYSKSAKAQQDAEAYIAMLKQVVNSKDKILANETSSNLYAGSDLGSYINNYMSLASAWGNGVADGDIAIVFTMTNTGKIIANAYPVEY